MRKKKKKLEWDELTPITPEPKKKPAPEEICCIECGAPSGEAHDSQCSQAEEKDTYRDAFEEAFKSDPLILCKCGDELNTDYEKRIGMCYMCEEEKKESEEEETEKKSVNIHIGPKEEVVQENPGAFVTFVRKVPKICAHLAYLGMGAWALYTGDNALLGSAGSLMIAVWIFIGG